jgi:hypothetical protein
MAAIGDLVDNKNASCPVCSYSPIKLHEIINGQLYLIACERCGDFRLSQLLLSSLRQLESTTSKKLSAWIRTRNELGVSVELIDTHEYSDIISNLPSYTTSEKQFILLKVLEKKTKYPGSSVFLSLDKDFVLAWAENRLELQYYLLALRDRALIQMGSAVEGWNLTILPDGWDFIDKYKLNGILSGQAFVAMSFSKSLEPAWLIGIKPAIEKTGYKALRIDKEEHIDRIDAKIISC